MRSYATNSPEAAARVVAMALLADGHLSMTEVQALDRLQVIHRLGLAPTRFAEVLEDFCHDLLQSHRGPWTGSSQLDPHVRTRLVAEITQPALQAHIMTLCSDIIHADHHLADTEVDMMARLADHWPQALPLMPGSLAVEPVTTH